MHPRGPFSLDDALRPVPTFGTLGLEVRHVHSQTTDDTEAKFKAASARRIIDDFREDKR
jgi:hypothetical protein